MDAYSHIKTLFAMIVGLALGNILRGLAGIVQHPSRYRQVYWVHLLWAFFLFIFTIHFWWWQFALRTIEWTFSIYLFVSFYAILIYFLSVLLFPDSISEYENYTAYFYSRADWIFGTLAAIFIADFADTWIKGAAYHAHLGPLYDLRSISFIVLSLVAMRARNRLFHACFAIYAFIFEIVLIVFRYRQIG